MEITVRLFATLRQEAGWSEKQMDLSEGATLDALLAALEQSSTGIRLSGRPVYAAVNGEYARPEQELRAGDVVALFPPVSGGSCQQRVWMWRT